MDIEKLTVEQLNDLLAKSGLENLNMLRSEGHDSMEKNRNLLMTILKDNKDTEIGKKYDFASIDSIEEYQRRLPITTYDDYADYVQRIIYNDEENLMTAYDFRLFCETNGTLGVPKIIPMSKKAIQAQMDYNTNILNGILEESADDSWKRGRALYVQECIFTEMRKGKEYGLLSAIMLQNILPLVKKINAIPPEVLFPEDSAGTNIRYLQARFGIMAKDVTSIRGTYLSFVTEVIRYVENNWELLVRDIEQGTIDASIEMPEKTRELMMKIIEPMPERAAELRAIFEQGFDTPYCRKVWPDLKFICGIGTGAFEVYEQKLKERYVDNHVQFYFPGISATEGLFSVPLEMNSKDSVLVPSVTFYEFLPVEAKGDFSQIVTMDQLETGKDYELIITNLSGLYRYRMYDCVRVVGRYHDLPMVRFVYRVIKTLDLLDDHTTEQAFTQAALQTAEELHYDMVDFSVFVDRDAKRPHYVYLMEIAKHPESLTKEQIRQCLNDKLCQLSRHLAKTIERGMCGPVDLFIVQDETYLLYNDLMVMRGRGSAQLKPVRFIVNEYQRKFFFKMIETEWEKA